MKKKVLTERQKYLSSKRRYKFLVLFSQIGLLTLLIILWEFLANVGVIDSFITSKPSKICATFFKMLSEDLLKHVGITCYETVLGFALGSIIGTMIASILWWSPFLSKVLAPYLVVLNSLPKVAFG